MRSQQTAVHVACALVALCAGLAMGTGCSGGSDSPPPVCGNSAVESGEACDDGNAIAGDGCEADCTFSCEADAACGDGDPCTGVETCSAAHVCQAGAPLDDLAACTTATVADGVCRSGTCVAVGCGNALVDPGEDCDDGNSDDTDLCLSTCVLAYCGDGFVHHLVEACDGGSQACTTTCDTAGTQACLGCAWGACVPPAETCNLVDDDCDAVVDEEVAFVGTADWRGVGGSSVGGEFYEDACPAGEAVIGFDGEFNTSSAIGSLRAHCGDPSLACSDGTCTATFAPATTLPLRGTATNGRFSAMCPAGQAIFGYVTWYNGVVNHVKGLEFRCAPIVAAPPGAGWAFEVGFATTLPLVGMNDGARGGADCAPGQVAVSVVTRIDDGLHGVGASCKAPGPGCP